jgi:hypothetical protein
VHVVFQLLLSGEGEVAFAALISALEGMGSRGGRALGLCRFESLESGDRLERLQQRSKTALSNQSTNLKLAWPEDQIHIQVNASERERACGQFMWHCDS